jgi:hypothetical protein
VAEKKNPVFFEKPDSQAALWRGCEVEKKVIVGGLDAKDREMECNGTSSSTRKKPQQPREVSGLQPQGVSLGIFSIFY